MKKMIFAAAAAFALILIGCEQEYLGPSADDIGNSVVNKEIEQQKAKETAEAIAQIHSSFVSNLQNTNVEVTAPTKMSSWGQTGAAYAITVNTVSSVAVSVSLPSFGYKWETTSTADADIMFSGSQLSIKTGSTGKTAAFKFTYTYPNDDTKKIEGTLTVTTEFDVTKADIASIRSNFEQQVGLRDYNGLLNGVTATKPIANWGQTDAAYTVTSQSGSTSLTLYKTISSGNVEWQVASGATATVSGYPNSSYNVTYTSYTITNYTATVKSATFNFRITSNADPAKTISGTITVTVSQPAETAAARLETIKSAFTNWPSGNSRVHLFWADTPISAWAQTNAKYTAQVKQSSSDYSNPYTLNLPITTGLITWSYTGAAVTGITTSSIGSGYISIDNSTIAASSAITLTFNGANVSGATPATVSGTLVLTVIKQQ